ncbi:MAG: hypothetical protein FWC26_10140 [Fibromonadales bacterium]|nr:hypothetical protein [Fibromonadales bacterium]
MSISASAFLFCLGFAVCLGYFFAWVYNYRKLHKEPKGKPQKLTDSIGFPVELAAEAQQEDSAIKRLEQEKICYETGAINKDTFIKKLLALFRSHLEKENRDILSICYWVFNGEAFTLRLANTPYRIGENLLVPKKNRYFSKNEFNWNGIDEIPIDIYRTEEQVVNSMAGAMVSGGGKLHGYITIDSAEAEVFDDEVCMELRELATLTEESLRTLDRNLKLDNENSLLNGMLKNILDLLNCASKGNLLTNLSKILQDNFRFNRLMIITPHDQIRDKWQISEAIGEQKEILKEVSFNVQVKCLLYELLSGQVSVVNEKNISKDPYQRRFYENEPENLELRSLFAVRPPLQNNSYPLIIVLESKNEKAVSLTDEIMLTGITACAAMKLSDFQHKDSLKQEKENALTEVDANGIGEILKYYETEIKNLENSTDALGILFLKCVPLEKEGKAVIFENFLAMLRDLKKIWNQHLSMIGGGEFVLSSKNNLNESTFEAIAMKIVEHAKRKMPGNGYALSIKSHAIWLNKDKVIRIENEYGQSGKTLFLISIASKFQEMSEAIE